MNFGGASGMILIALSVVLVDNTGSTTA